MNSAWLEELLPKAMVSPRSKLLWQAFLLLFPLAYLGGGLLEMVEERPARAEGALDRAMSIKAAQNFAESKGISTSGWNSFVIVESHDDLIRYYSNIQKPDVAAMSGLIPGREITVLLRSPDESKEFRTYLSLNGEISGFDMGKVSTQPDTKVVMGAVTMNTSQEKSSGDKPSDKEAGKIARDFLAGNAALRGLIDLNTEPELSANEDDPARTEVRWNASPAAEKELTIQVMVAVRDGKVAAQRISGKLDENYVKSSLPKSAHFSGVLNGLYATFLTFSAVYALFRYAKRTFQREVSHLRTLIVAVVFAVSYGIYVYCIAVDQIATRISAGKLSAFVLPAYVSAGLSFLVMGLLVGVAYGSGEGEVREAYPGKLTSLDALLAGKVFARDVASSILFGTAAAGWLLLCQHALGYFLPTDMMGARSEGLRYTFARLPWLSLIIGRQYESLLIAVAGLLLPASFLLRSRSRGKRSYVWLLAFALCSVMHDAASYPTAASALLAMGVLAAALLLPFFAFDLLAAMVSLSSLAFVNELARLSAVFPSWVPFAFGLAGFATALLAIATYFAIRGEAVQEEDVRPLYAKNLAERMGLQAEVRAAREAQLRLMPQSAPQVPGMEFAAVCLPAKGVGGDFYDFFTLDANRVGIFVAQGGERGLGSALCIALAKGVLMHVSQQTHSAAQIVAQLESGMARLLQGGSGTEISFIYAVVDGQRRVLNYARVGASPRVMIHRRQGGLASADEFERPTHFPGRPLGAPAIYEGAAHLSEGDHLIFFTDGVTSLRLKRFGIRSNQWVELLMRELGRTGEPLQTLLASALAKYRHKATDDLTAVVLRTVDSQAAQKAGAA